MAEDFGGRGAALKMVHEDFGPTLKAQVPLELSREDFVRIATESSTYRLQLSLRPHPICR
jgi:hypothetical protein